MKAVNEMSYTELIEEVQYIATLLADQPHHHDGYLLELVEAMVEKTDKFYEAE